MIPSYLSDFTENHVKINLQNSDNLPIKENHSQNDMVSNHHYLQKLVEIRNKPENSKSSNQTEIHNQNLKPNENKTENDFNSLKNEKICPSNNLEIKYQNSSVLKKRLLLNDELLNRIYLSNELEQENTINDMFDNMIVNNFINDCNRGNNPVINDKVLENINMKDNNNQKKLNLNQYKLNNPPITQLSDDKKTSTNCQNSSGDIKSLDSIYNIDIRSNHFILESEINYQISNSIENFISNLYSSTLIDYDNNINENSFTNLISSNKIENSIKNKERKIENQQSEMKSSFKNSYYNNKLSKYLVNNNRFKSSSIKSVSDSFSNKPIEIREIKNCFIIKNVNCTNIIKRNSSNSLTNESFDSQIQLESFQLNSETKNLIKKSFENPNSLNKQNPNQNDEIYQVNIKGKKFLFKESDLLKLNSVENVDLNKKFTDLSVKNSKTHSLINNDQIKYKKQNDSLNLQKDLESACYKIIYGNASEFSQQLIEAIDIKSKQNKLENEIKKVLKPELLGFNRNKNPKQLSAIQMEPFKLRRTDCNLQTSPSNVLLSQASSCNDNLLETYSLITETDVPTLKSLSISPKMHLETSPSKHFESKSNIKTRSTINNNKSNAISTKSIDNNKSQLLKKNMISIKSSNVKEELIRKEKSYFIEDHNFSQRFIPSEMLSGINENKLNANYSNGIMGKICNTNGGSLLNLEKTFSSLLVLRRSKKHLIKRSSSTRRVKQNHSIRKNNKIKSKSWEECHFLYHEI